MEIFHDRRKNFLHGSPMDEVFGVRREDLQDLEGLSHNEDVVRVEEELQRLPNLVDQRQ